MERPKSFPQEKARGPRLERKRKKKEKSPNGHQPADGGWHGKLRSMWESVFGDPKGEEDAVLKSTCPTWLLGVLYSVRGPRAGSLSVRGQAEFRQRMFNEMKRCNKLLLEDFRSRIWMTYRTGFPDIGRTSWSTDAGWGCMLRTAQMMVCQGFIMHYEGRSWRLPDRSPRSKNYAKILRWFLDFPLANCPYSLHNIVGHAGCVDKKVGEWFGPQAACVCLQRCHKQHQESELGAKESLPHCHRACDGTLYLDKILELCTQPKNRFIRLRMHRTSSGSLAGNRSGKKSSSSSETNRCEANARKKRHPVKLFRTKHRGEDGTSLEMKPMMTHEAKKTTTSPKQITPRSPRTPAPTPPKLDSILISEKSPTLAHNLRLPQAGDPSKAKQRMSSETRSDANLEFCPPLSLTCLIPVLDHLKALPRRRNHLIPRR